MVHQAVNLRGVFLSERTGASPPKELSRQADGRRGARARGGVTTETQSAVDDTWPVRNNRSRTREKEKAAKKKRRHINETSISDEKQFGLQVSAVPRLFGPMADFTLNAEIRYKTCRCQIPAHFEARRKKKGKN